MQTWKRRNKTNSRLADTPLFPTHAITDKIQIPIYTRGLTGNDSRYYGLSLFRTENDVLKVSDITRVHCNRFLGRWYVLYIGRWWYLQNRLLSQVYWHAWPSFVILKRTKLSQELKCLDSEFSIKCFKTGGGDAGNYQKTCLQNRDSNLWKKRALECVWHITTHL